VATAIDAASGGLQRFCCGDWRGKASLGTSLPAQNCSNVARAIKPGAGGTGVWHWARWFFSVLKGFGQCAPGKTLKSADRDLQALLLIAYISCSTPAFPGPTPAIDESVYAANTPLKKALG